MEAFLYADRMQRKKPILLLMIDADKTSPTETLMDELSPIFR